METGITGSADRASRRRHGLGTNQSGMRDYNERLVLSLVRHHGSLAKMAIARMTGLSAQTVSVIMRGLESEHLLLRGTPQRGRVGQPSIPMSLNPDGAYFIGLKIGRRSAELVLIDFLGSVRSMLQHSYAYPTPKGTVRFVVESIEQVTADFTPEQQRRIAGLGIAIPFQLWNWADAAGAPPGAMDSWRETDIRTAIAAQCPFPVYLQNDGSAACGAELVFGDPAPPGTFIYFYVGAFIGGGIAIDGRLHAGRTGNAGALGSMPVPTPDGRSVQLIDIASIAVLERELAAKGHDALHLWTSPHDWGDLGEPLDRWIDNTAAGIAHAILSAAAVIDFETAIVDGWMPLEVRSKLAGMIRTHMGRLDTEGLQLPALREGTVGIHARALGGASLPLAERFLLGAQTANAPEEMPD